VATPEVSVLLPVRDAGPWLGPSLASLARQRFADWEIVAVDDGSRDESGDRLERAARRFGAARMRVLHTPPRGLPAALALALAQARGRLLARHDADDLSHPDRLALQHAFLGRRREIAVVGTRLRLFPASFVGAGMHRWAAWHNSLLSHDAMAGDALIDSPLAHGTAMLRREWLERVGGWRERGWAEDLDLWLRLLAAGARFAKLPRVLYAWRQHAASATRRDPRYARERMTALKCHALASGMLAEARDVTVAGVGTSLARWTAALGQLPLEVHAVSCTRPVPAEIAAWRTPVVLVVMSAVTRAPWRAALTGQRLVEGRDFVFVA
jgi:glycosyltransferase involved in cell wall biosynthesis